MREILNPDLSQRTTLRIGGRALVELIIEREEDLFALPEKLKMLGGKPFWIGRGSNLLAKDGTLPLALVRLAINEQPKIIGREGNKVSVSIGAGFGLPGLLRFALRNSLADLEGLCGIPGSVGGAVAMNAGSFGQETANCLKEVVIWTGKEIKSYKINELHATYRNISFPGQDENVLVLKAIFTLTMSKKHDIFKQMNHNFFEKKFRQPVGAHSAGCVFKNPEKNLPAGMLLDKAGMKNKSLGGMAFSAKHANFLINTGKGTAGQALELLAQARDAVKSEFGLTLENEVKIIP